MRILVTVLTSILMMSLYMNVHQAAVIGELRKMATDQARTIQQEFDEVSRTYGIITSGHCDEQAKLVTH